MSYDAVEITPGAGMEEVIEKTKQVDDVSKIKTKKASGVSVAQPGECPVRCAILYKGAEELHQWLSMEQKQHMKRLDVVCQRPIAELLNKPLDSGSHLSTEHASHHILRLHRAPFNLFLISHSPLDQDQNRHPDPISRLTDVANTIIDDISGNENESKEQLALSDAFQDSCDSHLSILTVGFKQQIATLQPSPFHGEIISRRMLTPEELGIVSRREVEAPKIPDFDQPLMAAQSDKDKRRCAIL